MRKKVGILVLIGVLLLGTSTLAGLNAPFLEPTEESHRAETALFLQFSPPTVTEDGEYVVIEAYSCSFPRQQ